VGEVEKIVLRNKLSWVQRHHKCLAFEDVLIKTQKKNKHICKLFELEKKYNCLFIRPIFKIVFTVLVKKHKEKQTVVTYFGVSNS
jgi:hypothetical protein